MNEQGAKPVLRSTILLRVAMLLLLLAALSVAIAPKLANLLRPERGMTTSGDPADIRLVGVVPDGGDVLYDARGNVIPGVKFDWPGKRTYTWPQGAMLREFLFELGPGAAHLEFSPNDSGDFKLADRRSWFVNGWCALDDDGSLSPEGRRRVLFRASMSQSNTHYRLVFSGRVAPLEPIDVELHFFDKARGPALLSFDGPFVAGTTNRARDRNQAAWLTPLATSPMPRFQGATFEVTWTGNLGSWSDIFAYDTAGKRHRTRVFTVRQSAMGGTNQVVVPGVPIEQIAAIAFGEQPRVKRFHNVVVSYPDRSPRPHSVTLDRLAAALGKINTPAAALEDFQPNSFREAMTVLEYLPNNPNAVATLANANSTNFSGLTTAQRDKLRRLAAVWANDPDTYEGDTGLRLGLRGGWPEFLALAMTRLTNSSIQNRIQAANSLAWTRTQIGEEHVPPTLAIAWTNSESGINSSLLAILQRAGPAGSNALLELAGADAPYLWWGAMNRLQTRAFEPVGALSQEMQERVWLAKERTVRESSNAVITAALARLPGLLTPELQRGDPTSFSSALRRLQRYVDRPTAMAAMMKFLRDLPPEQVKYQPPAELVQQVNAWYRQDFGRLGVPGGNSSSYPQPNEWPGIVEDVLKFYEKLRREGKVAAEN